MFRIYWKSGIPALLVLACAGLFVPSFFTAGSRTAAASLVSVAPTPDVPVFVAYKGVKLGMSATDARAKLGAPQEMADTGDYYVFSENESAQLVYDMDHTVKVISVNFVGAAATPPGVKDVLGEEVEAKPDGSLFKLVRYPKSGCWVSYNRTVGSNPMTIVTMQKIPVEQ